MPEFIRVRDTSGHEITIRADLPEGHPRGLQDGMTVLDKPATNLTGAPLEPKHRTPLGTALPGSTPKGRRKNTTDPVPTDDSQPDNNNGQQADSEEEN